MDFQTVDNYIESFDGKTQEFLLKLRFIIREAVPEAEELINYNIAAFALIQGGKREEQIMMAGYKKHVGFYPHPTTMEYFWDRLKNYKRAKGSVQFPLDKPLPKKLIIEMVKWRKERL